MIALVLAAVLAVAIASPPADAHLAVARRSLTLLSRAAEGIVLARADAATVEVGQASPSPSVSPAAGAGAKPAGALGVTIFTDVAAVAGVAPSARFALIGAAPIVRYGAGESAVIFLSPGLAALESAHGDKAIELGADTLRPDLPRFSSRQIAGTRVVLKDGEDLDPASRAALADLWRSTHAAAANEPSRAVVTALVALLGSPVGTLRSLAFLDLEALAHHPAAFGPAQIERLERYGDAAGDDDRIATSVRALARRVRTGSERGRGY